MSSILKALEKVEESRRTGRNSNLGGFVAARVRRRVWVVPAGVLGGAVVAALATFAAMGGFPRDKASPPEVKAAAPRVLPAPPLPERTVILSPAGRQETGLRTPPGAGIAAGRKAGPKPAARPKGGGAGPATAGSPHPAAVPRSAPQETPAPAAAPARPALRVTGIAWQKDGEPSAAIDNGRPVQQGGVVDGFKVEEILPDKVRFSGGSGSLEVPLGGGE